MRGVIQRVLQAQIKINDKITARIDKGLLVYLAVGKSDTVNDAEFMADKLTNLRIFEDSEGKMNKSITDINGELMLVSNFTLFGDCRKGRRPSLDLAAKPEVADQLYEKTAQLISSTGITVKTGLFGQHMHISSINDGPINFLFDTTRLF